MIINIQSQHSGTGPHYRLATNSYILSMLPLPQVSKGYVSPFAFYGRKQEFKKKTTKISTIMWYNRFFRTVLQILNAEVPIVIPKFPEPVEDKEHDEIKSEIYEWIQEVLKKEEACIEVLI